MVTKHRPERDLRCNGYCKPNYNYYIHGNRIEYGLYDFW